MPAPSDRFHALAQQGTTALISGGDKGGPMASPIAGEAESREARCLVYPKGSSKLPNDPAKRHIAAPGDHGDANSPAATAGARDPEKGRSTRQGSLSALGSCVPVLIGQGDIVLDGWIRVEAAKALGLDRVLCVRIDHLTEVEQRLLRIAVNRLGEKGDWDLDALSSS
jgi:hypothetical protein